MLATCYMKMHIVLMRLEQMRIFENAISLEVRKKRVCKEDKKKPSRHAKKNVHYIRFYMQLFICGTFQFSEPTTQIIGAPDLYIESGSTINLTCIIENSPEPPAYIFWNHNNAVSIVIVVAVFLRHRHRLVLDARRRVIRRASTAHDAPR